MLFSTKSKTSCKNQDATGSRVWTPAVMSHSFHQLPGSMWDVQIVWTPRAAHMHSVCHRTWLHQWPQQRPRPSGTCAQSSTKSKSSTSMWDFPLYFTQIENWILDENMTSPESTNRGCRSSLPSPGSLPYAEPFSTLVRMHQRSGLCHAHLLPLNYSPDPDLQNDSTMCLWSQKRESCTHPGPMETQSQTGKKFQDLWYPGRDVGRTMQSLVISSWPSGEDPMHWCMKMLWIWVWSWITHKCSIFRLI